MTVRAMLRRLIKHKQKVNYIMPIDIVGLFVFHHHHHHHHVQRGLNNNAISRTTIVKKNTNEPKVPCGAVSWYGTDSAE